MAQPPLAQQAAVDELQRARRRIESIVGEMTDAQLRRQWMPILSPMVWDLAHVGNYEDLWLLQTLTGERCAPGLDELYDAFRNPRHARERLPLLGPDEARRYIREVRSRSLDAIAGGLLDPARAHGEDRLVQERFVVGLIVQHEHQHAETILQARQAMGERAGPTGGARPVARTPAAEDGGPWCTHPGGIVRIGCDDDPWAYDNERPAHEVELAAFRIARRAVTCGEWTDFIGAGGYRRREFWSEDGWAWRTGEGAEAPLYWRRGGEGGWECLRFGAWRAVDPQEPVQHVSWWEADAFARAADARLPTEQEWEAAAARAGSATADPGAANVGGRRDGPVDDRCLAEASAIGCRSMLGNVWEWTASHFQPWPGFAVFPYAEYSAAFFGGHYRVLRGGSWATDPMVCRTTFRNWDLPQRRQLFAGVRLAKDIA